MLAYDTRDLAGKSSTNFNKSKTGTRKRMHVPAKWFRLVGKLLLGQEFVEVADAADDGTHQDEDAGEDGADAKAADFGNDLPVVSGHGDGEEDQKGDGDGDGQGAAFGNQSLLQVDFGFAGFEFAEIDEHFDHGAKENA